MKKSLYTLNEKKNTNEFIFVKTKHEKNIYCKVWPAYTVSTTFHKYGIAMYYIVMEENQIATTFVLFPNINTVTWPEKKHLLYVSIKGGKSEYHIKVNSQVLVWYISVHLPSLRNVWKS